jgi:hypothetical protein
MGPSRTRMPAGNGRGSAQRLVVTPTRGPSDRGRDIGARDGRFSPERPREPGVVRAADLSRTVK